MIEDLKDNFEFSIELSKHISCECFTTKDTYSNCIFFEFINLHFFIRCTYVCDKAPTGPLNRKSLLNYIYDQAKKTPDRIDHVPYVPGI